ncbi:tyrosine-protein phosphatase 99A-like [Pollicipes pollicipes]|uniref:tyrosine-protein phosphatase 99A-like n=1 Tax=Pollicipes pollicipes TaxID=41117 RepID=UPI0018856117|nr:tyrosine-protein phosphatase 99A-like [Pollicipes pollicipes]
MTLTLLAVVVCALLLCGGSCSAEDGALRVFAGANLTLPCPHHSEVADPLMVTWSCRGCGRGPAPVTVAQYGRDGSVSRSDGRVRLVLPTFQLHIYPASTQDAGVYVCSVNNAPSAESITVTVEDVPRAPQRPLVVSFTSRSAELSWAPLYSETDAPALNYLLQKRRYDPPAPWDLQHEVTIPDNRTTFNVTGLKPFTAYSFRIFSVNKVGRSLASEPSYPMVTHREPPSGKPTVVKTFSPTADTIEVIWRPPDRSEMNGEFIGHVIAYRPRDQDGVEWTTIDLPGNVNETTSYIIEGLTPYTEYLVRVQVKNMMGVGPFTVVKETTKDGVPARPENFTSSLVGDSWAVLSWNEPIRPNGVIVGYYMYFEFTRGNKSITDNRIITEAGPQMTYNLTGLDAYTQYTVWLHAKTSKHEGQKSENLVFRTDVGGPSAPLLANVTCQADTSIYVRWRRPERVRGSIDLYYVRYRSEYDTDFERIQIPTAVSVEQEQFILKNLTTDTMYEVSVVGVTKSRLNTSALYWGQSSEVRTVVLQPDCEKIQYLKMMKERRTGWSLSSGMVAGLACASFALLLAMLALIFWRKYFQAAYNYLDEPSKTCSTLSTDWENDSPDGSTAGPIPVHLFPKHVSRLHADGDIGFSKEYEAIQTQTLLDGYASDLSQHTENKDKNRYLNIVAYDHTRVPLQPMGSQKQCDYVNANYIDGYQRRRVYIGTQGPLPATFDSFWRMVWEQDVHILVMITNLVERGRDALKLSALAYFEKKCDRYWPQEGTETFGVIKVTNLGQDVMATYTIRKFRLQHLKMKKKCRAAAERTVYQYHYTNWPDHGIPESPLPILSFVRKSAAANPEGAGPIVVHCSAGVGRTGTYIVLDSMMRMIRAKGELNVFGFLKYIRTQRNFLVQTEEQYIFLHDALLELIESGETDIHRTFLRRYLHNLLTTEQDVYPWYNLDRQFRLVTYDQAFHFNMASGRHPANVHKSRRGELLPTEASRVCITPRPGVECSDYINASWLPGFSRLREFVVTQHPLASTLAAFWQMVWDHNAQTIVLLSPVDDQEYCIFWPLEHDDIDCEQFRVCFTAETQGEHYVLRDFTLQSHTDDYELAVRIIQCSNWPATCSPIGHVFDLIQVVQRWHLEYQNGPCVVVDRFGGTEAATFCCLTTLMKQLEYESHADVYMYARLYHTRRPGVWRAQDDFLLLYRAAEALIHGTVGRRCRGSSEGRPPLMPLIVARLAPEGISPC